MKIETKRLILRPLKKKDFPDLIENINNLNVSRFLVPISYPYTIKDAEYYLKQTEKGDDFCFSIELKSEKKVIGGIGLHEQNFEPAKDVKELGYWIGEKYWRNGYCIEAIKALLNTVFNNLKIKKVLIPVFTENKASNNLAKKIGAELKETRKKSATSKATGKTHDENIYELTKEQWKNEI
ncbi:GNAT family N-acetyltransferase [Candidatus Pacearchaeota archaeon]|nr:GNAT family N-acetyltransferase [Candidatus Pacearchaeota archaeon]MBD3283034.1 GNAT family N-acetyltransferase [Candidatus Pacearchaeota archaeon]